LIAASLASAPELAKKRRSAGDLEQVRRMPELGALFDERGDQMGMRITERGDRYAAAEIEVAFAIGRGEPAAVPSFEGEVGARIDGHDRG
jgi:hypothetical protein